MPSSPMYVKKVAAFLTGFTNTSALVNDVPPPYSGTSQYNTAVATLPPGITGWPSQAPSQSASVNLIPRDQINTYEGSTRLKDCTG